MSSWTTFRLIELFAARQMALFKAPSMLLLFLRVYRRILLSLVHLVVLEHRVVTHICLVDHRPQQIFMEGWRI